MRPVVCALALGACASEPSPLFRVPLGYTLPPARVTTRSELVLRCVPPDAEVSVDGVPQGLCEDFSGEPGTLPMRPGMHRVEVKKRGFLPWSSALETDGTRVVMNVTLLESAPQGAPTGGTP